MYMHQVIYSNKLKYKCTLTLLDPRLLYIGLIQVKGHLSFRDTCPDSYNYKGYLSILYVFIPAAYSDTGYLSVLYSIR